jgi:hypothetical protein
MYSRAISTIEVDTATEMLRRCNPNSGKMNPSKYWVSQTYSYYLEYERIATTVERICYCTNLQKKKGNKISVVTIKE